MNNLTNKLMGSTTVELMKEGLSIAEAPLAKILKSRSEMVKKLYTYITGVPKGHPDHTKEQNYFKRAKSEEEMLKAVMDYVTANEALMEAMTQENQTLREKLSTQTMEMLSLRERLSQKSMELFMAKRRRPALLNMAVDRLLLAKEIDKKNQEDKHEPI